MRTSFAVLAGLSILAVSSCGTLTPVMAQHNHDRYHVDYQSWSASKVANCCSNQDCGELKDEDVRQTATGTEIKIAGEWCPVRPEHFIIRGKSPDWNIAHACVSQSEAMPPCERLLCFTGKGGF